MVQRGMVVNNLRRIFLSIGGGNEKKLLKKMICSLGLFVIKLLAWVVVFGIGAEVF